MISVATEMTRRGLRLPLLIGGATTSGKHTAVKVAPAYAGPTIHVPDASLAVGVMGKLLSKDKDAYIAEVIAKQASVREAHVSSQKRPLLSFEEARKRRLTLPFGPTDIPRPPFLALTDLIPWIDWSPFFHTWELSGRYPAILDDPKKGDAARKVFADGQGLLAKIVADRSLTARATYGYFPAGSDGDDIIHVFTADRGREVAQFPMPRQREDKETCLSLADFIAPLATIRSTTIPPRGLDGSEPDPDPSATNRLPLDHLGAFIVTAGIGTDALAAAFEREHDDYYSIMAKALADRLAEAAAEVLHMRVRHEWYAPDEKLDHTAILAETYRGIRPAFGYPACPEHAPKATLFELLNNASHHGVTLTESFAMYPTASVSGLYFAHAKSQYFAVGRSG
jgi:5-methyltetrahydrofolate--homocysteine methyltransferase